MKPILSFSVIKQYKWLIIGGIALTSLIILVISVFIGKLDCEKTSIREGVYQTCDCKGLEIAVKSTTNSGEKKTICIGVISNKKSFK